MSTEYNYCRGRERRRVEKMEKRGSTLALMKSKRRISLLVLLMLFLMIIPATSADLGTPVYSSWTTNPPTIDGVISGGEWTDATLVPFTFDMRLRALDISIENLSAIFYVKNDGTNIYAAAQIFNEDYDARDAGDNYDGFALLFEDNHDHILADGDNGEGIRLWTGSTFHTNNDWYYNSSSSWLADGASPPFGAGQTNDGALAWTHTNTTQQEAIGDYTFEMRIPLVGSDGDAYDLTITSCATTLGFKIWFFEADVGMDGVYPDDTAPHDPYQSNNHETEDGAKFGNLVLACPPPPPAVGGIAAPIVIPINKLNLLTPLFWLASALIFSIALVVVFVKLKKKKL